MEEEKKEKPVNKSYRWREQNTIIILGIPVFRWRCEIYENPASTILLLSKEGRLETIGGGRDDSNSK